MVRARYAERSPRSIWRAAAPRITAGLGAHSVVVALTALTSSVPLLTALVATLVFAGSPLPIIHGVVRALRGASRPLMVPRLAGALALVSIGAGAWVIGRVVGTGAAFYCEPLVPWRIEIALFGSFVGGYLTVMAHAPPGMGSLSPYAACPSVDCALLRVLLGARVPWGQPQHAVPQSTAAHGAPHGAQHACGGGVGSAVADWMSGRSTAPSSGDHDACTVRPSAAGKRDWSARRAVFPAAQAAAPGRGQRLRRCGASASVQPRGARHWDALLSTVSAYTVFADHA